MNCVIYRINKNSVADCDVILDRFYDKTVLLASEKAAMSATFPQFLKESKLVPDHKLGSKRLMNNFRPISVLSSLSKIIERVLSDGYIE
jgi:hypothetical protein